MPLVMNCLDEPQTACVGGNYFSFKAEQIRPIHNEEIAKHIGVACADKGFVVLPVFRDPDTGEEIDSLSWTETEAGKAIVAEAKGRGIAAYCEHLRRVANNLNFVRQDMESRNMKGEVWGEVHPSRSGEAQALEKLSKYQKQGADAREAEIARIKKLERDVQKR